MQTFESGTFAASLAILQAKGVRFSTVIDLGCADGHFYLTHYVAGLLPNSVIVNVDANAVYEPSLKRIRDVVGGHYVIAAVSDTAGEIEMTTSIHPYWNSLREPGDTYWQQINNVHTETVKVPAVTLDDLAVDLQLKPPFLLKLDIQGAELAALRGARRVLDETDAIICEVDLNDFAAIHASLDAAGFELFDLTGIARAGDGSLGWFYPVYINRRINHVRARTLWAPETTAQVLESQVSRRKSIVLNNAILLQQIKRMKATGSGPAATPG